MRAEARLAGHNGCRPHSSFLGRILLQPRIIAELKAIVGPDNLSALPEDTICYSYDGTPTEWRPGVVVTPTTTRMVADVVKLANRERVAIVPRGAGTGLSGGSVPVGGGLVLSLTKMNRILEIDVENLVAVAQPGVVTATFQAEVERHGLFYPPDPASQSASTLGGNVAECAGGPRGFKYGVTKDYVLGLEVVTPTGQVVRLGGKTIKNATGYNLVQLFVGSEGTLGVVTEITLRLIPKPKARRTLLAVFPRLDDASQAVTSIVLAGIVPATIELMDNTTIRTVETYLHTGLPVDAEAVLLIEIDGEETTVVGQSRDIVSTCREHGASQVQAAATPQESDQLWRARRAVSASLARARPTKLGEDIVVPRKMIPAMVKRIQEISRKYNLPIAIFGHAGDGNLHPNILFDIRASDEVARVHQASDELFAAAVELGGTLSGEHGIGLLKRDYMLSGLGPEAIDLMRQIKTALDPLGIMNPGKVFPEA